MDAQWLEKFEFHQARTCNSDRDYWYESNDLVGFYFDGHKATGTIWKVEFVMLALLKMVFLDRCVLNTSQRINLHASWKVICVIP